MDEHDALVQAFERSGTRHRAAAGAQIFAEGASGDHMYLVRRGTLTVTVGARNIALLGPDDVFGERSVIDGSPRSATVTANSDCDLVALDGRGLVDAITMAPFSVLELLAIMARRLRSMNELL